MKFLGFVAIMLSAITVSSIGTVQLKAGDTYEVTKSTFHYSPIGDGTVKDYYADVYFSQGYFEHPSTEYDPHLATTSLCLAVSTFTDFPPFDEAWYLNQSRKANGFFEAIGFNSFVTNDDYKVSANFDTLGLCAAKKEFPGYTLIGVAPRSGGYKREWANNMRLGDGSKSDMMHEGWYNAANKMISFVQDYVSDNNVTGKVKLWMSGFSRGGATTNIAAALLDNRIEKGEKVLGDKASLARDDLFAYTFESPQGANVNSKTIKKPKDALYNNIFNVVNPLDAVPKVAMKQYGFTRFGVDKYVTNKFYDPANYEENRRTARAMFDVFNLNKNVTFRADEFKMVGFGIENFSIPRIVEILTNVFVADQSLINQFVDKTKANYDANIAISLLIEEVVKNLGDRNTYVRNIQNSLESMMLLLFNEAGMEDSIFKSLAGSIASSILDAAIGNKKSAKAKISETWGKDVGDVLYDLIGKLLSPLIDTYWERPNELISIALSISDIFQNHNPDVNLTHVASQDSYYIDEYNKNKSGSDKIKIVPFLNNADYGRMKFFGYNDIGLRLNSKKGTRVINIEGFTFGKSVIHQCDNGYASGYYSYVTEEKMEAFMPANRKYNISMKSYSKKPYHRCEYWAYYEYFTLDNSGRERVEKDHKKEKTYFNSDRHKRDVNIVL